ncbi:hypothetical protein [Bacillus sp. V59.32b]|nr:hypothetical protein [Bacillus sp. V59.32b]
MNSRQRICAVLDYLDLCSIIWICVRLFGFVFDYLDLCSII